jgi:hypothetical protein
MLALGGRDDGGVADQRVVDTRVRDQVGLELVQIDVQGTVEAQRRGDGRDDLGDQAVEVLVARPRDIQIPAADVVHGLVINQEGTVRVLNGAVGREHSVVGLNNGSRNSRGRVNGELEFALLAIIGREALKEEGTKTRASTATEGVEDQEALEGLAVVWRLALATICAQAKAMDRNSPATRRMRSMTLSIISLPMV